MDLFNYSELNQYMAERSPSTVHIKDSYMGRFFRRYLLQKAMSVFKWTIPEWWDLDYLLWHLYAHGYVLVIKTKEYGPVPQYGTPASWNMYYKPKSFLVTNPNIKELPKTHEWTPGTDCTVIRLTPDMKGIGDLIGMYADQMALAMQSLGVNVVNSKFAYMFGAKNKQAAESMKKAFDEVMEGNPAVFIDTKLISDQGDVTIQPFINNLKANMIGKELLDVLRTVEAQFDEAVGLANLGGVEKKERMTNDEVNSNNESTMCRALLWYDYLQKGIEDTKKLFPDIELTCEFRFKKEGGSDDEGDNLSNGTLQSE